LVGGEALKWIPNSKTHLVQKRGGSWEEEKKKELWVARTANVKSKRHTVGVLEMIKFLANVGEKRAVAKGTNAFV